MGPKQGVVEGRWTPDGKGGGTAELPLVPDYPGWMVVAKVEREQGTPTLTSLTICRFSQPEELEEHYIKPPDFALPPPSGVTGGMLKAVRITDIERLVNDQALLHRPVGLPRRHQHRAGSADVELVVWALRYVEARRKDPRRQNILMARRYHKEPEEIREIVRRCRARGLLTRTKRGKPGGDLTDYALQLLEAYRPELLKRSKR
jgi:hypothetical protein